MHSIRTVIAAAILAAGMSTIALAADGSASPEPTGGMHEGHGGHFGPRRMFDKLGLSADQKAKADAVFAAKEPVLKNLHQQIEANMEKLHKMSPDDPSYASTVSKLAQAGGSLTTQMISAHGDMRAQLWAILTPAQRTQLAAMEAKMHEHMEHMRGRMKGHGGGWDHQRGGHDGPPHDGPPPPPASTESDAT